MARHTKFGWWKDQQGDVINAETLTVSLTGTTTVATIYEDEVGGSAITNGAITLSNVGFFQYWVDEADYATTQRFRHTFTGGKFKTLTLDDIVIFPGITASSSDTLTNKKLVDASVSFVDDGDNTKQLKFQCSGIAAGTTRTWTVPNSNDTFVGKNTTDTLENKTVNDPVVTGDFSGDAFLDEDDMASNSDVKVVSQQSIKAHVASFYPTNYRSGGNCKQASTVTITVEAMVIDVDGTRVTTTSDTTLNLTTDAHWIGGTSQQTTGAYGWIYVDASGNILMENSAPDESDTSGNTSGILRYNDFGGATDYRCIGWFYMNATGAGELFTFEVSNLKDGDVHNSVVRTDSTQNTISDTTYGTQLTNTQIHFYSSGRGVVTVKCHIAGTFASSTESAAKLNDGSDIPASEDGDEQGATSIAGSNSAALTPMHAEVYPQGGITFEAKAVKAGGNWTVEEKAMVITEN